MEMNKGFQYGAHIPSVGCYSKLLPADGGKDSCNLSPRMSFLNVSSPQWKKGNMLLLNTGWLNMLPLHYQSEHFVLSFFSEVVGDVMEN